MPLRVVIGLILAAWAAGAVIPASAQIVDGVDGGGAPTPRRPSPSPPLRTAPSPADLVRIRHNVVTLPAGRYRLSLRATSATGDVETLIRCEMVVTATAKQESPPTCGRLGTLDVSVTNGSGGATRAAIRLAKGPNQVMLATERAVSHAIFRVSEGNYTVRADGIGERFVAIIGGRTTTVATAPAR